jgi:hypothetical protein
MSVLVVVSFIAFIVNVGLFVKAKINLQNAVDAAAYSGASVQARQLTNIAYLNWELRNTFKEWMFKYYILGQKSLRSTLPQNIDNFGFNGLGGNMNFRVRPFVETPGADGFSQDKVDHYNVPSICIDFGASSPICDILAIPGLPRFNTVGLPSISEHNEAFLNSIVATKAKDCSERSAINQGAAVLWAYGTGNPDILSDPKAPAIAASRIGAWVEALTLGLRMRNLEAIVNQPPTEGPICINGNAGGAQCTPVENVTSSVGSELPFAERTVKAFWSAYRNLGGGANKDGPDTDPFFSNFRLTEIPPTPLNVDPSSLSGFLIPPNGAAALEKHYLDLQIYPLNFAPLYTTLIAAKDQFKNTGIDEEAQCGGVKTALPVPGYILGFTKNPEVLTYYAVKGESNYVGLFYPFADTNGVKLTAYSAAKPFGGRIGPKLFNINPGGKTIAPRQESNKQYTSSYASIFEQAPALPGGVNFKKGFPIPYPDGQLFWADPDTKPNIGGNPTSGEEIGYVIPNLLYDFRQIGDIANISTGATERFQKLSLANIFDQAYGSVPIPETGGLYNREQFRLFASNELGFIGQSAQQGSTSLTAVDVLTGIYNSRRPTRYEALNYLLPVMVEQGENPANVDHNGYVYPSGSVDDLTGTKFYNLFAPLHGNGTLYEQVSSITTVIDNYINDNKVAIKDEYIEALRLIADSMRAQSTRGGNSFSEAADGVHKEPLLIPQADPSAPECQTISMAQSIAALLLGDTDDGICGIIPLKVAITRMINEQANDNFRLFHNTPYTPMVDLDITSSADLMTGFMPGVRQGAEEEGLTGSPFQESNRISKRSFYSTKFFGITKVMPGGDAPYNLPAIFMEGNSQRFSASEDFRNLDLKNPLQPEFLDEFPSLDH